MSLKSQFRDLAAYNAWANRRLYDAAAGLSDADYHRDVGAFFRSLSGTLNHIAVADVLWLQRLTGQAFATVDRLDFVLADTLPGLRTARDELDRRLTAMVDGFSDADLDAVAAYRTMTAGAASNRRADMIQHVFNHQTHHRGQAHVVLSLLRPGVEPPALDLIRFLNTRS
ncbi:DinB family protein [Zavarzinia compransoris]|uniref:Damage-inducible protein DinB n=1 Tax=Zavarzinia compransoris TaxID=1264899 RepID=A0A317EBA0_9PROT|nr:DinB family protein [Zavarzinia compransoris]PWR23544.1 damage-inducible protein DinB [Zavarzinia compransoris]TDP47754.1 putative damage-inducible protein DinB [Zavarzinia compransoris]